MLKAWRTKTPWLSLCQAEECYGCLAGDCRSNPLAGNISIIEFSLKWKAGRLLIMELLTARPLTTLIVRPRCSSRRFSFFEREKRLGSFCELREREGGGRKWKRKEKRGERQLVEIFFKNSTKCKMRRIHETNLTTLEHFSNPASGDLSRVSKGISWSFVIFNKKNYVVYVSWVFHE